MKKLLKFVLAAAVFASLSQTAANAIPLSGYDTSGSPDPLVAASDSSVTASNFTRNGYANADNGAGAGNFGGAGFYGGSGALQEPTLSGAISDGTYFGFSLQPSSSSSVLDISDIDFSTLKFAAQVDSDANYNSIGVRTFVLESNVTGFGTGANNILATYNVGGYGGVSGSDVTLSSAFNNIAVPAQFRLYTYDSVGGTDYYASTGISGSFLVNGSVISAAPEPAVLPMLGLGLLSLVFLARRKLAASL